MAGSKEVYPITTRLLGPDLPAHCPLDSFAAILEERIQNHQAPAYLADLAELEESLYRQERVADTAIIPPARDWTVCDGLILHELSWKGLPALMSGENAVPVAGTSHVCIVPKKAKASARAVEICDQDLLALKLVAEKRDIFQVAAAHHLSPGDLFDILEVAAEKGLLNRPQAKITRGFALPGQNLQTQICRIFTLQWHITQDCDLHCRHCYDRSARKAVELSQAKEILRQFSIFCSSHGVRGQISFSGGNPLLHPHFHKLYQLAHGHGMRLAILGNPTGDKELQEITAIKRPEFFQISLEGLPEHNDYIRGVGHFKRSMEFLPHLQKKGIYSMVMLTLTGDNLHQVLPLAELLRGKTDLFTFNRLAAIGEGAALPSITVEEYRSFLKDYLQAAKTNPVMGIKDSLANILFEEEGARLMGGCTGFGCGAAYNFISLLPDGEVHACRKLPSKIGNINQQSFAQIYHSNKAKRYRSGSTGCMGCSLQHLCRGCPAVINGHGGDIFSDIDPHCFKDPRQSTDPL